MQTIILMHQTVMKYDAIGNDIEKMYQILSKRNKCYVFAINQCNDLFDYIDMKDLKKLIQQENTVVIYHHSIYWKLGEEILEQCQCKIVIRYHNVTPPEFFEPYNEFVYNKCKQGREQTTRFAVKFPNALWLSASGYSQKEVSDIPVEQHFVCAPFHKIEDWTNTMPDEKVLKELLYDKRLSVLSVGRVAPNKGHRFLLNIINCYCQNYDSNIVLRIVGKLDNTLKGYTEELLQQIHCDELKSNVEFIEEVSDATLLSYYLGSDVFLCASEHEGFCVPLLAAQSCELPIIARNRCAVSDTLGWGQLLLQEDIKEYVAALHEIKTNKKLVDYLRVQGKKNISSYTDEKLTKCFIHFMKEKVGVEI